MTEKTIDGIVINKGILAGKLIFVRKFADLERLNSDSIAVLDNCGKSVSLEAINRSGCAISAQMSLTSHLSLNLSSNIPYVIAPAVLFLKDGISYKISIHEIANLESEMLRFVARKKGLDAAKNGGKGSKLLLLKAVRHINVPYFEIVSVSDVCAKIYSAAVFKDFINAIDQSIIDTEIYESLVDFIVRKTNVEIIDKSKFDGTKLYAVRSSAIDEDGEQESLAGYFESFLNIKAGEIDYYVRKVIASAFKEKELAGQQVDFLRDRNNLPKIAVVIQEMVSDPLYSGTFFSHMANDKPYPTINAVYKTYADELMDGTRDSDLTVNASIKNNNLNKINILENRYGADEKMIASIFSDAIKIYKELGYGDSEFVVDTSGIVYWVQARPLVIEVAKHPIYELVDRTGFDKKAIAYYKKLAPRVCVANNTGALKIKIFNITDAIFGYGINIRKRDSLFLKKIKADISFLDKVTKYGWLIENRLKDLLNEIERGALSIKNVKEDLFDLLISHGAVQLPFSIPTSGLKDRHQSYSLDAEKEEVKYFDELAQQWIDKSGIQEFEKGKDLISFLRNPVENNWRIMQYDKKLELSASRKEITYLDCYSVILFEFRDLPYIHENLHLPISDAENDKFFLTIKYGDDLISVADALRKKNMPKPVLPSYITERDALLTKLYHSLPEDCIDSLRYIEKYLLMKGETNETHSLYRGSVFLLLAMNKKAV